MPATFKRCHHLLHLLLLSFEVCISHLELVFLLFLHLHSLLSLSDPLSESFGFNGFQDLENLQLTLEAGILSHGLFKLGFNRLFSLVIAGKEDSKALVLQFLASGQFFGETRLDLLEVEFEGFQLLCIGVL